FSTRKKMRMVVHLFLGRITAQTCAWAIIRTIPGFSHTAQSHCQLILWAIMSVLAYFLRKPRCMWAEILPSEMTKPIRNSSFIQEQPTMEMFCTLHPTMTKEAGTGALGSHSHENQEMSV